MTLKEFKRIMSTGTLLLIGIIVICFMAYLISTMWPLLFEVIIVVSGFGMVAFTLGAVYDILTGGG